MLKSHELFGFMSPALANEILTFTFESEKPTYRAVLHQASAGGGGGLSQCLQRHERGELAESEDAARSGHAVAVGRRLSRANRSHFVNCPAVPLQRIFWRARTGFVSFRQNFGFSPTTTNHATNWRYRSHRSGRHGPESHPQHERPRLHRRGLQPHHGKGGRVPRERSQGHESPRRAFA
jgi:hypothetical protein